MGGQEPNVMERLVAKSDQAYIASQTQLRDKAKAQMAAKFGGGRMGDVGSEGDTGGVV